MYKKKKFHKSTKKGEDPFEKDQSVHLIIVESPCKCGKIESFLGEKYKCIASKGHIRIIEGLRSIHSKKNYEVAFSISPSKKKHVENMRTIISQFPKENIILATDDDREGEAIAWHICEVFDFPIDTTKRIVFNEITKTAIEKSLSNPSVINMNLVHSQHARQILDMMVGFKISPILWKFIPNGGSNSLSAGRCQTPALRLIYDNEMEKRRKEENQTSKDPQRQYGIHASFFSKNIMFELSEKFDNEKKITDFFNKSKNFQHFLFVGSPTKKKQNPPKPFNTSNLLQSCNNLFHISPNDTMKICQSLYQDGHITYMRTDNQKYSKIFLDNIQQYITKIMGNEKYVGNLSTLKNEEGKNPHEAIRVTDINIKELHSDKNTLMNTVYKLIWRNTIESCMSDYVYEETPLTISAPDNNEYKHKMEIPVFYGWRYKENKNNGTEIQNKENGILLYLKTIENNKTPVNYNHIETKLIFHKNHSHLTESGLIKKLEDFEIGRPSTFSVLVETIKEREYVKKTNIIGEVVQYEDYIMGFPENEINKIKKEKKTGNENNVLVINEVGIIVMEFLLKFYDELFSYDYTKKLEQKLDDIANYEETQMEWQDICRDCEKIIKNKTTPISNVFKLSYKIENDYNLIFSKNGPVLCKTEKDADNEGKEEITYKSLKKNMLIDIDKLRKEMYKLDDLLEIENKQLGKWEDQDLYIKNGKHGVYLEWGENKKRIEKHEKTIIETEYDDVVVYLKEEIDEESILKNNKKIIRIINQDLSIRNGRYGAYVYYKTQSMKTPEFYNIKKFDELKPKIEGEPAKKTKFNGSNTHWYKFCDKLIFINWMNETYGLSIELNVQYP